MRKKYHAKMKELMDQGMDLEHGLKNPELRMLKRTLHALPDDLAKELEKDIEDFEIEL